MATQVLACDYLTPPASPAAIKAAGYVAVLTYLRVLTTEYAQEILAAGLGLATIFETTAEEALKGAAAGTTDGQTALAQARAVGQPAGTWLTFNIADFQPTAAQIPALSDYMDAFEAALDGEYVFGPYGTSYVITQTERDGSQLWWQNAEDDEGVSGSIVNAGAALYQRVTPVLSIAGATAGWDEDVILKTIPWWTSQPVSPPTPAPPSTPGKADNDMLLIRTATTGPTWLLCGGKLAPVDDAATLTALQTAGIATAEIASALDFKALIDAFGD